ncbi:unnamed protein product [Effrenium voratum]|uniref:RING-type domain-containing protein n=1 Tax=Effrenium voratum TaxID=2562239 RepID=A0AA36MQI7_9DINO|nr:unnamed protein product [Effrenium voratum]
MSTEACCICLEHFPQGQGIQCSEEEPHFLCKGCLQRYVQSHAETELRLQRRTAGRIVCPSPSCSRVFSHHSLALHLSNAGFEKYLNAMFKVVETEALATAHAPDPSADWLELMRRRVVEDILTLKCQACGQAFIDFEGCFALTCSRCKSGMCGWCGKSFRNLDLAHDHVRQCLFAPRKHDLYGSQEEFARATRERRMRRLESFLTSLERSSRQRLLHALLKELADLGDTAAAKDLSRPQSRRPILWPWLVVALLICVLARARRQNNPTLIEILAEADQASQSFLATAKSCCLEYLAKIASDVGDIALDMRDAWVQNSAPRSSASWERVMDNILLTPQLMVNALALLTLLLVAFALGVPVAVLAVLLKLDVVQRFLAWCYLRGGRWLRFFRLLPDDDNFKRLIERRRQLTRKAAVLGHLKSMQVTDATPLAFTSFRSQAIQIAGIEAHSGWHIVGLAAMAAGLAAILIARHCKAVKAFLVRQNVQ